MRFVVWMLALVACEQLPPTGDPLAPVRPAPPAPAPATATGPASGSPNAFDFAEDEGTDADPLPGDPADEDPAALLALAHGRQPPPPAAAPTPEPPAAAPVDPPVDPAPAQPLWDPASAPPADWGVHLVSTLVDTQPPMAVLGLPNGDTVVVKPGALLADRQLVVLAVGRDAVHVARIVPEGYRARIEPHTLQALYPGAVGGGTPAR